MLSDPPPAIRPMLEAFRPVLTREVFVLGATRVAAPHWPLADFFDGLEGSPSHGLQAKAADSNVFWPARA
jgi:hypothetical protein